ncbi:23S rRNA (guanosine(2251)-2'-O)-methyltransferase RlmB [Thioalkalivibrio denitrificans]|uniref:23S rRNA (guanosine-2'-O-)-methyltransferase RlmB n=1 Tax=Thioalkalivibrio denitrificans TaxID=108003 RepID=A0A1V3NKL9_9GAMM|nr:23S rRNA (guanosine(2251)-2'-O)-methyltransferase RlmB [Thioalkalivibrio denitrificans]OOG25382.1 23S rRNA (guanosine(2251)-2'-O)-methyltransferase RlmB [Thioalkalivibrio denitrificans]
MTDALRLYGLHPVLAALRRRPVTVRHLWADAGRRDARMREILSAAHEAGVRVERVEAAELERLCPGVRHQGVVAEGDALPALTEADLPERAAQAQDPLLLVLDGVTDPHNLGACLRTADAAGVMAVVVPKDRAAGLTPAVRKVASGAAESVPLVQVTNLARTLDALKAAGVWVAGTDDHAPQSLYQADLKGPLALVLGAEGQGMRRLTRDRCDLLVSIPMLGSVSSLNVSVAAGVCLFEAVRQRQAAV